MTYEYCVNEEIPHKTYVRTINDIFTYLESYTPDWVCHRVFIDGHLEPNQSKFESESNLCKIGVIANSDLVGHCLLVFLRMIIDKYPEYLFTLFDKNKMRMEEIINVLNKQERTYTRVYSLNDTIHVNIVTDKLGTQTINKIPEELDLWDLQRTKKVLNKLLSTSHIFN